MPNDSESDLKRLRHENLSLRTTVANIKKYVDFVLESMMHGLIMFNKAGEVMVFNKKAEDIFNLKSSLVVGNNYHNIFPKKLKETFDFLFERTLKQGRIVDHEIQLVGDREKINISISTATLKGEANDIIGITAICRNLSLSREILRLREIDKIKNDFISMVSHELRTPLSSIMACAETLRDGVIENKEEKQEFYSLIFDEAFRLNNIVNDVLDLSKIESGRIRLYLQDCSINEIIKSCISSNQQLIANSRVQVKQALAPGLPSIRVDRDRIMQVVINILSNAVKFTQEGGTITVQTGLYKDNERALVSISDTGTGIKESDFKKVFEKFVQIDNAMPYTKGTGLGMPISKELIESHGGKIWFESEFGRGTTFHFTLPLK
jgi:PAS domain S-box-containing protein